MKKIFFVLLVGVLTSMNVNADGYQDGWKVYEKPQPGVTYGGTETNPYGPGGGQSYGEGGGKNLLNPWAVAK